MENKLKVAVFNTQPPHLYFGGVERRILENAKHLKDSIQTTVYSGTKKGFKETTEIDGTVFVPCSSTDIIFPLDNWTFNRSIAKMVNKIEADIYEAHAVSGYKFQKALKKNNIQKPFIQNVHGVLADEYIQSSKSVSPSVRMKLSNFFMKNLGNIEKEATKQATLVVTVSNYSAGKIAELYGVDEKKIRVVPNGVDIQRFKPTNNCDELNDELHKNCQHLILFVGNLIPRKGLHYLIEAAKQVTKEHSETKFVIVGNGPLKNNLIEYTKQQGVYGNFTFLGDVSEAQLHNLYACADIFASPSIQEGQGISLLEAQATAKPVVAFNVTAIKEVVKNKETGLIVEPNSKELASAISYLLSNKELREKMGKSAREFVSNNFTWEICSKKMLQVYNEVSKTQL